MERQTDEQMNRTLSQKWRFDYVFRKLENKTFLNYLA